MLRIFPSANRCFDRRARIASIAHSHGVIGRLEDGTGGPLASGAAAPPHHGLAARDETRFLRICPGTTLACAPPAGILEPGRTEANPGRASP